MCSCQLGEAILLGARSVSARLHKFLSGFSGPLRERRPSLGTAWRTSAPVRQDGTQHLLFSLVPRPSGHSQPHNHGEGSSISAATMRVAAQSAVAHHIKATAFGIVSRFGRQLPLPKVSSSLHCPSYRLRPPRTTPSAPANAASASPLLGLWCCLPSRHATCQAQRGRSLQTAAPIAIHKTVNRAGR